MRLLRSLVLELEALSHDLVSTFLFPVLLLGSTVAHFGREIPIDSPVLAHIPSLIPVLAPWHLSLNPLHS